MTQNQLQTMHNFLMQQITFYTSGIITIAELQNTISKLELKEIKGLIDPMTGLRF
jgi:hypothetical protein